MPPRNQRYTPPTKPVDVGEMYEVDIIEIIVFIQNGKIGNKIGIKVTEVADRFAKATIEV